MIPGIDLIDINGTVLRQESGVLDPVCTALHNSLAVALVDAPEELVHDHLEATRE